MPGIVGHVDYVPTFLSLLGTKTNLSFDGYDMWDLVTGSKSRPPRGASSPLRQFRGGAPHRAGIICGMSGKDPGLGPALYDLDTDPKEEKNVAANHPDVTVGLDGVLESSFNVKLG